MNKWLTLLSLIIVVILAGLWRAGVIPAELAFGIGVLVPGGDTLLRALGVLRPPITGTYLQVNQPEVYAERLGQPPAVPVNFEAAAQAAYEAYGAAAGWLTVAGTKMPAWADQSQRLRDLWYEAARGAHGKPPLHAPGSLSPSRTAAPSGPPKPPAPRPGELVVLALILGALTACVAPARRNEARATFTAAQEDQVAAAQDLAALDREHQQDLALEIPRAGATRVRAAVVAWRGRRADVLATSERLAREAAEAKPTMEGSGDPAALEELAQRAKEGAAQLRAAITGLRAYGAEQLRELAPQAAPADGGVR